MTPSLLLAVALAAPLAAPTAAIRVDQVGYPASAPKVAMVVAPGVAATFTVHRVGNGRQVFAGQLSAPIEDADSGDLVRHADFSGLKALGRYELRVAGVGRSVPFEIGKAPYRPLLRLAARSYYGQRCGTAVDLGPELPGYHHPACHLDGAFHASSGRSGVRPPSGGWHDAGDYGRYVVNSGISTGTLLWTWELYGKRLGRLELGIPESGDRTPDLLDEVRWNLEWMLSMQDDDGGVWHKQTSEQFAGFVEPHVDSSVSYVIGTGSAPFKSSCASADFAAVMAIAGRVYRGLDAAFAERSLAAARAAWSWLETHPNVTFRNPTGVGTGEYGDGDCSDERLWAAAELWRTARDPEAHRYFLDHAAQAEAAIRASSPPAWPQVGALAAWTYALDGDGDAARTAAIRQRSLVAADDIATRARGHAYRIPMTRADYIWGSNAVAANYGLQLLVANALEPRREYVDAAREVLHYLLGRNTFSLSWVTGVGTSSVRHPHHRPSAADANAAPWPGLLAGGPNQHRNDDALRALPADLPPARVYVDDVDSYAGNEVAINWNAPLVFLVAGLN
jgi:endoglucanase